MNIADKFEQLRQRNEKAMMPYICVGDPDPETSVVIDSGADIIELGIPFSDPIADGPTIQRASERALSSGINTDIYFDVCKKIKPSDTALVSMTYYNIILQYGMEKFVLECVNSGVSGIIVPDLPVEESAPLQEVCENNNVSLISFIAPTTTDERMENIIDHSSGFIYLIALLGVTGARDELNKIAGELVIRVKSRTSVPVCLGFGISKPQQVREAVESGADGVIVGSAIVNIIEKNLKNVAEKRSFSDMCLSDEIAQQHKRKMLDELKKFIGKLKRETFVKKKLIV